VTQTGRVLGVIGQPVGVVPGRRGRQHRAGVLVQDQDLVAVGGGREYPMHVRDDQHTVHAGDLVDDPHDLVGGGVDLDDLAGAQVDDGQPVRGGINAGEVQPGGVAGPRRWSLPSAANRCPAPSGKPLSGAEVGPEAAGPQATAPSNTRTAVAPRNRVRRHAVAAGWTEVMSVGVDVDEDSAERRPQGQQSGAAGGAPSRRPAAQDDRGTGEGEHR